MRRLKTEVRKVKGNPGLGPGAFFELRTSNFGLRLIRSLPLAALITRSLAIAALFGSTIARADDTAKKPPVSAPQAVREGNLFLKGGNPDAALERYRDAKQAQPDAREIAFDEGLAHYQLGEFDKAREAFDRAAQGKVDALADDALYSAGASDHAEAVAASTDPKKAISKLENAMEHYQSVLSRRSDHPAARDGQYKAASLWKELKQQLQQQQQQQQQNDSQENNEEKQEKSEQQQSSPQDKQDQQQQEQQQQSESQQQQQQQEKSEEQKEQQAQQQEKDQEQEAQEGQEEKEEQVSREQAERKLREVMQAQKDRKKMRREDVREPTISRVDKDW